jgi:hypothetical protein
MAAYPSSDLRPASVMWIRSTVSVAPRYSIGSVATVASLASTRLESISVEKPRDKRNCSVRPLGGGRQVNRPGASIRLRICSMGLSQSHPVTPRRVEALGGDAFDLVSAESSVLSPIACAAFYAGE